MFSGRLADAVESVIADAYETFPERAADHRSGVTKQDRVRNYMFNHPEIAVGRHRCRVQQAELDTTHSKSSVQD
jgi:hypothetical protein